MKRGLSGGYNRIYRDFLGEDASVLRFQAHFTAAVSWVLEQPLRSTETWTGTEIETCFTAKQGLIEAIARMVIRAIKSDPAKVPTEIIFTNTMYTVYIATFKRWQV